MGCGSTASGVASSLANSCGITGIPARICLVLADGAVGAAGADLADEAGARRGVLVMAAGLTGAVAGMKDAGAAVVYYPLCSLREW